MRKTLLLFNIVVLLLVLSSCSTAEQGDPLATTPAPLTTMAWTPTSTPTKTPTNTPTLEPTATATPKWDSITINNLEDLQSGEVISYRLSDFNDEEYLAGDYYFTSEFPDGRCNTSDLLTRTREQQTLFTGEDTFQSYLFINHSCQQYHFVSALAVMLNLTQGEEAWLLQETRLLQSDIYNPVTEMALSPDGNLLFVSKFDKESFVFDLESKSTISSFSIGRYVGIANLGYYKSAVWSPDSLKIAYSDGGTIYIYDVYNEVSERIQLPGGKGITSSITWSEDGTQLAVAFWTGESFLINVTTNKIIRISPQKHDPFLWNHRVDKIGITKLVFSPKGDLLVGFEVDSNFERYLRVWNTSDGNDAYSLHFDWKNVMADIDRYPTWSPNGNILSIPAYGFFYLFDTKSWEMNTFMGNQRSYSDIAQKSEYPEESIQIRPRDLHFTSDNKGFVVVHDVVIKVEDGLEKLVEIMLQHWHF